MSSASATVATRASEVPLFARQCLEANPLTANLILPTLYKCLHMEREGRPLQDQLWIVIHIEHQVIFIVSCTTGYMEHTQYSSSLPVPYASLHPPPSHPLCKWSLSNYAKRLPSARILNICSPRLVSITFAQLWTQLTGVIAERDPYYHAKISYLTRETFINKNMPPLPGALCDLRPGVLLTLPALRSCATDSRLIAYPPFTLSKEQARREAQILVESGSVWVYSVTYQGQRPMIASIVATTRNTQTTATVTKVFTHPNFRGQGCAEVLVRKVCKELLNAGKQYIVLYVGLANRAANVYKKVGFVGIGDGASSYPGVDPWLELGFDQSFVQMGHW
ncbi:hypothetical protein CPB84DRAFT_1742998 [Gymnopilus junonius]|uniref:N-acetyltransferase domain-containing protein n=1 Tax=Gymnopilus junonius TaxID=109634 RepID=A0A9P5TSP3_GYMJU|nr:hypothetical protein CPB84DRAFT_1742998 [Gymnopilus junonius]